MTVGKICNREVVITTPEATLIAVAKLMREYHVGDVVVVNARGDEKVPVGIITDRDIRAGHRCQRNRPGRRPRR